MPAGIRLLGKATARTQEVIAPRTIDKALTEAALLASGCVARLSPSARTIVPNKVVFANQQGLGYGCNPRYLAEALLQRDALPLDLVWLGRMHEKAIPARIRQVPFASPAAARELATARVWVFNSRWRRHVPKRPGQFYLQTWHGALSPKPIEADAAAGLSALYVHGAKTDSAEMDLAIANNAFYEQLITRSFWYDGPVLRCGMPRNAPLVHADTAIRKATRKRLGVAGGTGMCLYAPTFRQGGKAGSIGMNSTALCQALSQRFGKPFSFVWRLHPNVAHLARRLHFDGGIDATDYPDASELLAAADVVVSDYSSVLEDFALTGRPGYTYAPDEASFSANCGLYYPLEARPFPVARTFEQLLEAVRTTSDADFDRMRPKFFQRFGIEDDGNGVQVLAQMIEQAVQAEEG